MSYLAKAGVAAVALVILALISLGLFYVFFVTFVDNYEQAYQYDVRVGKIEVLTEKGWIITPPILVKVHTVDLRPMQVCISTNQRVLNCKLVQFDPEGLELFLAWHGRSDYPGGVNSTLNDILKTYAYEGTGKAYPFLRVIRELKPGEEIGVGVTP